MQIYNTMMYFSRKVENLKNQKSMQILQHYDVI